LSNKNTKKSIFAHSTLGIQLALFMVLFVYGGFRLDNYLETSPLFVALGCILGLGAGLYNLIKGLQQMDKLSQEDKTEKENKTKWL
jgi:F0F1-type ATP synthase assembly protein I